MFTSPLFAALLSGPAHAQSVPVKEIPTSDRPVELGIGGGIRGFSVKNELGTYDQDPLGGTTVANAIAVDVRGAYRLIRHLWLEPEASLMPTRSRDELAQVLASDIGGNVLYEILEIGKARPFVLAGAGALFGQSSDELVLLTDTDTHTRFGVGTKVALADHLGARADARLIVPAGNGSDFAGSPDFKIGVGLYTMIGKPQTIKLYDHDRDGLFASDDQCPRDAEDKDAFEDDDGCPDVDNDSDGIADIDDGCPMEAETVNGTDDADGCPEFDADSDGIFDASDACVDDPETRNGYEDADGCPDEVPEEVKAFTGVIEGIHFDVASATITRDSFALLDSAVKVLLEYTGTRMEIAGHTDDQGAADYNLDLSQRRADSVRTYLVEAGVPSDRVIAVGYGLTRPIAEGVEGRAANRRVEFQLITDSK